MQSTPISSTTRVKTAGKFFTLNDQKFYVKGVSYGPFADNSCGEPFPERDQVRRDFAHIRDLGGNTVRVYFPPPRWLLDEAAEVGIYVFIDIPWEKHRCFLEDWGAMARARNRVRQTARDLGDHPATFAISVVNEIPVDTVRYQGRRRVAKFVEDLVCIVKEEAPDCLSTFVNFPTTEFLEVQGSDFTCFNVYLHDENKFGEYLDRLQHIAGNSPLVLGEYGVDSQREGDVEQAGILTRHLHQVYAHGLSGSVIFAYTDDWFTGGHQITDWFFGITRADRSEKLAATAVRRCWQDPTLGISGSEPLPKVSVVVCSYNGGKTLHGCLDSLMKLDYPDYEIILVDDGSTDSTAQIAAEFPQVIYHHQSNRGLSVARNVGAGIATGEIVAYTDDDCVADEHWLRYLVTAMADQQVEAIGGPNITPPSDGWLARCVAASPGNPSHVMLNDTRAEHVPGCNMAFRRSTLLGIGGFDPQFRVAGDDVDVCWRLLDADLPIGYAPGAMVWHHRRATVKAYGKQQKGYGRSEALVHFKHPQRFGRYGRSNWSGIIYGEGAVGLPLMPDRIYHGRYGDGLFQTIYRHNHYGAWCVVMSLEWHMAAVFGLLLSTVIWQFSLVSLAMWMATLTLATKSAIQAPLPREAPNWCRPVVAYLYLMQPIWRGWNRLTHLLRNKRYPFLPEVRHDGTEKSVSACCEDIYWDNHQSIGREHLLASLVAKAKFSGWSGDFDNAWADWDVKLVGDRMHDIRIWTATEELGWPHRFTRARIGVHPTTFHSALGGVALAWIACSIVAWQPVALAIGLISGLLLLFNRRQSRRRCLRAAKNLLAWASIDAGLVDANHRPQTATDEAVEPADQEQRELAPLTESVGHAESH